MEIGRVTGPHGVKGKVKVSAFSGDPAGLLSAGAVRFRGAAAEGTPSGTRDFEVRTARPLGGCAVLSLEGIGSAAEARAWTGAWVAVPRDALPPAGEDEYYWADLVGCEVVDCEGAAIGPVVRVEGGAAHDWLVILRRGEEALLPVVGAFIVTIDLPGRRIVASPPAGW